MNGHLDNPATTGGEIGRLRLYWCLQVMKSPTVEDVPLQAAELDLPRPLKYLWIYNEYNVAGSRHGSHQILWLANVSQ